MPKRMKKVGASSASNNTVTNVSGSVGSPNQSVEAIQMQYNNDNERSKENFAAAIEALKQLRDPNRTTTTTINAYDRETIRSYLQNPVSNANSLLKASNYFFIRSQIFFRIIMWYAGMWDLRCRNVSLPIEDLSKSFDSNALSTYLETLNMLDVYKIEDHIFPLSVRAYLEDVVYFLWFKDDTGAFPYILEPDECMIDGRYTTTGDFSFAMDMSKWRSQQRQQLIEWLGDPLDAMYREYQSSGVKWVHVPDEYAGCFKYRSYDINTVIPPLIPIIQQIAALSDLEDLQAIADQQSVFKMLIYPLKTISGSKVKDDFQIDPIMAEKYFNAMLDYAVPEYVSAAFIPGDGLDVIDFSSSSTDKDFNRLADAQKNLLNTAGGGAVLNGNVITSAAAFEAWLQSESDFAITSLRPQVEGFVNRHLSYDLSNPCKVYFYEVTKFTKQKKYDQLLELNQHGYSARLALGTLVGHTEKMTLSNIRLEQELLELQNLMQFPLQSSYTQSGSVNPDTDPVTGGAPEKDATDLTPSGDRDRNQ